MNCTNFLTLIGGSAAISYASIGALLWPILLKWIEEEPMTGGRLMRFLLIFVGTIVVLLLTIIVFITLSRATPCSPSSQGEMFVILATSTPSVSETPVEILTPTQFPSPTISPTVTSSSTPSPTTTFIPIPAQLPLPTFTVTPELLLCCFISISNDLIIGYHQMSRGETVYCIGRGYGVLPAAIVQANSLKPGALLHSGLILKIPAVQWVDIPPGPVCPTQFQSPFPGLWCGGVVAPSPICTTEK